MLYIHIEKSLDKGIVTIKDSFSYKALDEELLAKEYWNDSQDSIIQNIQSQLISTDIEQILNNFELLLDKRYHEINQKINSGLNDKIKVKFNGSVANKKKEMGRLIEQYPSKLTNCQ